MQGRTNVKDGISLNATVAEMEVDGNSIVAGNFVQYKTIESKQNVGKIPADYTTDACTCQELLLNVTGNYYVGIFKPSYMELTLLSIDGEIITFLDTFAVQDTSIINCLVYDGYIYALSTTKLYKLEISNGTLNKLGELTITSYGFNLFEQLGSIYVISRSGTYNVYVNKIKLDDFTIEWTSSAVDIGKQITSAKYQLVQSRVYDGYIEAFLIFQYVSSNNQYRSVVCLKISTTSSSVSRGNDITIVQDYIPINMWWYDDETLAVFYYHRQTGGYKNVVLYNVNQYTYTIIDLTDMATQRFYTANTLGGNGFFIINSTDGKQFVINIDKQTSLYSVYSNKIDSIYKNTTSNLIPIVINNTVYTFGIENNINECLITSMSQDKQYLSGKEDTSYVQNWDGDYKLIGVAKQSGTAGDTIEVYIPTV